jgi:hypothetical protein
VAWLSLDWLRPEVVELLGGHRHDYRMLLIFPALMAVMAFREYAARAEPGITDRA